MNKVKSVFINRNNRNMFFSVLGIVIFSIIAIISMVALFTCIPPVKSTSSSEYLNSTQIFEESDFSGFNMELFIFIITILIAVIGSIGLVVSIVFLCIVSIKRRKKITIAFDDAQDDFLPTSIVDDKNVIDDSNNKRLD